MNLIFKRFDRFVMSGAKFKKSLVAGSAGVFRFDTKYKLTQEQVDDIILCCSYKFIGRKYFKIHYQQ